MQTTVEQAESSTKAKSGVFHPAFSMVNQDWKWGAAARYLAAFTLVISAGLKGYQVARQPMPGSSIFAKSSFIVPLVEIQGVVGILLFFNVFPRTLHRVVLTLFAVLLSFSIYNAITGADNCHCFGAVHTNPQSVAVLDFAILSFLAFTWRSPIINGSHNLLAIGMASLFSVVSVPLMLGVTPLGAVVGQELRAIPDGFDFGTVKTSAANNLRHIFTITNYSNKPVRILGSKSTCRCTVAELNNETVMPGKSAFVSVTANWTARFGSQREEVYVFTDSPTVSHLTLSVTANLIAAVVKWPDIIDFGEGLEGSTRTRKFYMSAGVGQGEFHVNSVQVSDHNIVVEPCSPDPAEPQSSCWTVKLSKDANVGDFQSELVFAIESSDQQVIKVPVIYRVLPSVRVTPNAVVLWPAPVGCTRFVSIDSSELVEHLSIEPVENSDDGVVVEMSPVERSIGGFHYAATISVTKPLAASFIRANMVVAVRHSSTELPIYFLK